MLYPAAMLDALAHAPSWAAAALFGAAYFVLSWFLGDVFPFSLYSAYAKTGRREEGAVLFVTADGVPAALDDYVDIAGIRPHSLHECRANTSLKWQVHEAVRYLENHAASAEREAGPVRLVIGYHKVFAREAGLEVEDVLAGEGTAWPRT